MFCVVFGFLASLLSGLVIVEGRLLLDSEYNRFLFSFWIFLVVASVIQLLIVMRWFWIVIQ